LANALFHDERARSMFAGIAAHAVVPLDRLSTAGYGLALAIAGHAFGWPVARGGSVRLAEALAAYLQSLGGEIVVGHRIDSLDALPPARAVLCDVSPRQLIRMAGSRMPGRYRAKLERYRYGPGVFKMDWALNAPVPWRASACHDAGTIHLGGTMREISFVEREVWNGRHADRPYMIVVQASRIDPTRAPSGHHTLWGYCHVPHGSTTDMRERMEDQLERAAPGFRDCVAARSVMFPADLERRNANLVGGDIAGGAADLSQLFTRPVASLDPYATPMAGVYLCSASTPPGVGVHGMGGYYAAQSALKGSLRG
jgi:phytoene dehydrogenase-like protein